MSSETPQNLRQRARAFAGRAVGPIGSLGLIGFGCWLAWPPAGFIAVGALIWLDLSIGAWHKTPPTLDMPKVQGL